MSSEFVDRRFFFFSADPPKCLSDYATFFSSRILKRFIMIVSQHRTSSFSTAGNLIYKFCQYLMISTKCGDLSFWILVTLLALSTLMSDDLRW